MYECERRSNIEAVVRRFCECTMRTSRFRAERDLNVHGSLARSVSEREGDHLNND